MIATTETDQIQEPTSKVIKRKVRAPERYREDGTYYTGPKDPKAYFNNYYHTKGAEEEECMYCHQTAKKSYMYKHRRTKKCQTAYLKWMEAIEINKLT